MLDDDSAVMSERGTAKLLNIDHAALIRMVNNGFPKTLKPFIDNDQSVKLNLVEVI